MSGNDEEHMVSNPAYERLEDLRERVNTNRDTIEEMLKDAKTKMEGGETWTGRSAAEPFTEELVGRHNQLSGKVDGIIEAIDQRMSEVPDEIESPPYGGTRPN